jgi:hypothetical protein
VFREGECVVLRISRGRITGIVGHPTSLSDTAHHLFFTSNHREVARNAGRFSELGFGVNRAITRYHGLPVFDEKIYGTIHVAFGRNDQLGGQIKGKTHHDLVIKNAVVTSDGFRTPLVSNGTITIDRTEVEPDWTILPPETRNNAIVRLTGAKVSINPETAELAFEWMQCEGSSASTRVGARETSRLAARIVRMLEDNGDTVGQLCKRLGAEGVQETATARVLTLLHSFGLIAIGRK